jgi:hypothetical protein
MPFNIKAPIQMKILIGVIALVATICTSIGIFSGGGPGPYNYTSIRNNTVTIFGKGVYHHMSAEVAPQGIAQDYITLFIGIPLLMVSFWVSRRGSIRGKFILAGVLGYFTVTYLFYLVMAMYNYLFLGYVILLGASFFAFLMVLSSFELSELHNFIGNKTPVKAIGGFLIFVSFSIAFLWLSIVIPPLLNGTLIPKEVEHYTTLIVQGLDLAILLPSAFIIGNLFRSRKPLGLLLAPVYFIFLSMLMTALTAKVIAMWSLGYNVIPVIFIIPPFNLLTITCAIIILKNISNTSHKDSAVPRVVV